jgi:hypothetical protein
MKTKIYLLIIISIICFTACKKRNTIPTDNLNYFTFGKSYYLCSTNCEYYFRISNNKLYKMERTDRTLKFDFTALPKSKCRIALQLKTDFPEYLLDRPNTVIGQPDNRDQGAINIEIAENGIIKEWKIDPDIENLPVEIRNYISSLSNTIERLK